MDLFLSHALLTVVVVALTMCTTILGLTLPIPIPASRKLSIRKPNATIEFLHVHNQARKAVGVASLQWSKKLATDSGRIVRYQRNYKGCKFAEFSLTKYGMNQLLAVGAPTVSAREAVESWVEKKKYYVYANNTCAPHQYCGVYKQVVWKKSTEVGCAQALCPKEQTSLTLCLYYPPGNVIGEKPY